jgi:hypothetical protein
MLDGTELPPQSCLTQPGSNIADTNKVIMPLLRLRWRCQQKIRPGPSCPACIQRWSTKIAANYEIRREIGVLWFELNATDGEMEACLVQDNRQRFANLIIRLRKPARYPGQIAACTRRLLLTEDVIVVVRKKLGGRTPHLRLYCNVSHTQQLTWQALRTVSRTTYTFPLIELLNILKLL